MDLLPGQYVLKITEVKAAETRKRLPYFEVFHTVVESNNDKQPVGSISNRFCMLTEDLGLVNMKELLCVMQGLDPHGSKDAELINSTSDADWQSIAELAVSEKQPFNGVLVRCVVVDTVIKQPKPGGRTTYPARRYAPHESAIAKRSKK